jgi:transcription-repair coupling factor (superfamily II helicase)
VGFELYTELLSEAVERAKGQPVKHEVEPEFKLPFSTVIPEDYVPGPVHRLEYYRRMSQAPDDQGVFDVVDEITGEYGPTPSPMENLIEVMLLRKQLMQLGATHLSAAVAGEDLKVGLTFLPDSPVDRNDIISRCQAAPDRFRLTPSGKLALTLPVDSSVPAKQLLQMVRREVSGLKLSQT